MSVGSVRHGHVTRFRRLAGEGTETCLEREEAEGVLLTSCVHAVDDAVELISKERTSRREGKSHVRSGTSQTVSASPKAAVVGTYYVSSITSAQV